tara:strand:+ start:3357 stop:3563 length:207 start_codon:yes stop_codon:yes gene_type:complete
MVKQITLFFQSTRISFMGMDADHIRARRYDFSQFGDVIGGEGEGWEVVAWGMVAPIGKPIKENLGRMM